MVRCRLGNSSEVGNPVQGDIRAARHYSGGFGYWSRCQCRTASSDRRSAAHRRRYRGFHYRDRGIPVGRSGRELLIPTLVLLFGADIKLAGSLSLAVSLPTTLVGFSRYSRDQSFSVLGRNKAFVVVMAAGSILGTFIGGRLLGIVQTGFLLPALAVILLLSAVKVWRHT